MVYNYSYNDNYNDNYMYYCEMEANKMYPELYNKVYPYVKRKCEVVDNDYNQMMNPFPNKETVDKMVEEIYTEYKNDHGEEESPSENYKLTRYNGFIGRDLISILLLRQLLGRRRRRRIRPYGGFGGYGGFPFY